MLLLVKVPWAFALSPRKDAATTPMFPPLIALFETTALPWPR